MGGLGSRFTFKVNSVTDVIGTGLRRVPFAADERPNGTVGNG